MRLAARHTPDVRVRRGRAGERRPRHAPRKRTVRTFDLLGCVVAGSGTSVHRGRDLCALLGAASARRACAVVAMWGLGVGFGGGAFAEVLPPMPEAALPSAQEIAPYDMVLEDQPDGQVWLVLRYLAPRISREGGDLDYAAVAPDLDALCDGPGRAGAGQAALQGDPVDQVVVILMDRPGVRGAVDPGVTAFMSAYRLGPEGCQWQ